VLVNAIDVVNYSADTGAWCCAVPAVRLLQSCGGWLS